MNSKPKENAMAKRTEREQVVAACALAVHNHDAALKAAPLEVAGQPADPFIALCRGTVLREGSGFNSPVG